MIYLKKEFVKKGVRYNQVLRDEEIVVYVCAKPYKLDNGDVFVDKYLEVFKPRTHKKDKFHNDDYELYPNDESFGLWAWCVTNVDSLMKVLSKHFQGVDADLVLDVTDGIMP